MEKLLQRLIDFNDDATVPNRITCQWAMRGTAYAQEKHYPYTIEDGLVRMVKKGEEAAISGRDGREVWVRIDEIASIVINP